MKKIRYRQLISGISLIILLTAVLSVPVMAAGAFPFNKYSFEDNTLEVYSHSGDEDDKQSLLDHNLLYGQTVEYSGIGKDGLEEYNQTARVTFSMPDNFFYLKESYLTDPENPSYFSQESDHFYEWYDLKQTVAGVSTADNTVDWGISQKVEEFTLYKPDYGQTIEEAMEIKAEEIKNYSYSAGFLYEENSAEPLIVNKDESGYTIISHFYYDLAFYYDPNGANDITDYFDEVIYYSRIMKIDELPGVFVVATLEQHISSSTTIQDSSFTEYEPIYENEKDRIEGFRNCQIGEKFVDLNSLMTITWQDPTVSGSGEETEEPEENEQNVSVTQFAKDQSGEDGGVSVPAAIVIGVLSTGTSVGGAVLAGSRRKKENEKTPRSGGYKMYIQKDFGDSIRRGGKPVIVRARMAETDSLGKTIDRPDLTEKISASSGELTIHKVSFTGKYCEATVSVPKDQKIDEAGISFIFTGEGGTFTNNVIFRVTDGASIKFTGDNVSYRGSNTISLKCIYGDGFKYSDYFRVLDAPNPPLLKDITAKSTDQFDISFENTEQPDVFKVIIANKTAPLESPSVFFKEEEIELEFSVIVEGEEEPLNGYIYMNPYPEGLSVKSRYQDKKNDIEYVRVQAYEKDYHGDLDNKWQVSELIFTLAVKEGDTSVIDPDGANYSFKSIIGSGGKGSSADKEESIAKKFKYKEECNIFNDKFTYTFEPNSTLCEPEDGSFYLVLLPSTCEYKGKMYSIDVPLRLQGLKPDPMEGWDEEYKKLQKRIEMFSIPGEKGKWLNKLEMVALDPKASTEELRIASKYLVRQYMRYWTVEGIASLNDAELYDDIVGQLEWIKFFGDCAFSYLVNAYAGPVAEALISPAKDFIAESLGELFALWNHHETITIEKFSIAKYLEAAGDNLVSNNIDLAGGWKQAAKTLAAYFVYSSIKNYIKTWREKGKSDVWGSIVSGFADMTAQGLKTAASELFKGCIKNLKKNEKFQKFVGQRIAKFFNDNLGRGRTFNLKDQKIKNVQYQLNDALGFEGELRKLAGFEGASKKVKIEKLGIIEKYLSEFVGKEAGDVAEYLDDQYNSEGSFAIGENGHILFKIAIQGTEKNEKYLITIDFNKISFSLSTGIFGVMWNLIFEGVPFAGAQITIPKDPPLPAEKK
jgi:hypothetical protein